MVELDLSKYIPPIKLDFGAGPNPKEGYISCDSFDSKDLDVDLTDTLPFPDAWADEIQGLHVLEHMPWTEIDIIFKEWCRVLKPGGLMVIEIPNMEDVFRGVLEGTWKLLYKNENIGGNAMVPIWGEVTNNSFMHHKAGFTPDLLIQLFQECGLVDICWINNEGRQISKDHLGWAMRLRGIKQ